MVCNFVGINGSVYLKVMDRNDPRNLGVLVNFFIDNKINHMGGLFRGYLSFGCSSKPFELNNFEVFAGRETKSDREKKDDIYLFTEIDFFTLLNAFSRANNFRICEILPKIFVHIKENFLDITKVITYPLLCADISQVDITNYNYPCLYNNSNVYFLRPDINTIDTINAMKICGIFLRANKKEMTIIRSNVIWTKESGETEILTRVPLNYGWVSLKKDEYAANDFIEPKQIDTSGKITHVHENYKMHKIV